MLLETDVAIIQVATSIGYADQSAFSRQLSENLRVHAKRVSARRSRSLNHNKTQLVSALSVAGVKRLRPNANGNAEASFVCKSLIEHCRSVIAEL